MVGGRGGRILAFVWFDGVMSPLHGLPGALRSRANDINELGQIVAAASTAECVAISIETNIAGIVMGCPMMAMSGNVSQPGGAYPACVQLNDQLCIAPSQTSAACSSVRGSHAKGTRQAARRGQNRSLAPRMPDRTASTATAAPMTTTGRWHGVSRTVSGQPARVLRR